MEHESRSTIQHGIMWSPRPAEDLNLVPQINQPVKIIETLEARSVTKTKKGYYLFDAGENIAGWCNITA